MVILYDRLDDVECQLYSTIMDLSPKMGYQHSVPALMDEKNYMSTAQS